MEDIKVLKPFLLNKGVTTVGAKATTTPQHAKLLYKKGYAEPWTDADAEAKAAKEAEEKAKAEADKKAKVAKNSKDKAGA